MSEPGDRPLVVPLKQSTGADVTPVAFDSTATTRRDRLHRRERLHSARTDGFEAGALPALGACNSRQAPVVARRPTADGNASWSSACPRLPRPRTARPPGPVTSWATRTTTGVATAMSGTRSPITSLTSTRTGRSRARAGQLEPQQHLTARTRRPRAPSPPRLPISPLVRAARRRCGHVHADRAHRKHGGGDGGGGVPVSFYKGNPRFGTVPLLGTAHTTGDLAPARRGRQPVIDGNTPSDDTVSWSPTIRARSRIGTSATRRTTWPTAASY